MKKIFKVMSMIMLVACSVLALTACSEEKPAETPTDDKVAVCWYYGSKLLKEEEVEKGTKLVSWTPEEEGKTFTGWFAEASTTTPFDFEKPVNEDTDIFAAFKSDEYVEDENSYYLIGTGAGDMGKASWDHAKAEANLTMEKQEVEKANVYKIQIKMYAGDQLQVCFGGGYDGQQGIGIMVGAEYCDGVNKNDGQEYTAADRKVAQVKDAEGNVVFVGYDQFNNGFEVWNAILAEGYDGIYEFTLTTYPNAKQYNTLEYRLVEKIDALASTHEMYLIGVFNNWAEADVNYKMTESEDKSCWTGFITITPEHYAEWAGENVSAFKVFNGVDRQYYPGENIIVSEGTYAVKYNVADNSVQYEKCEYYIVGTLKDSEGAVVDFSVKEGVSPKLVAQEDGSYAVDFEAYDVSDMLNFNWMTSQGKVDADGNPAKMAIKVVFGSSLGIKDWYSADGGDNWYLSDATYSVVLAEGAVTVTKK